MGAVRIRHIDPGEEELRIAPEEEELRTGLEEGGHRIGPEEERRIAEVGERHIALVEAAVRTLVAGTAEVGAARILVVGPGKAAGSHLAVVVGTPFDASV